MMAGLSFSGVAIVAAAAFAVPLLLGLAPSVRLPSVVLEILAGIVIGPAVLGWVQVDPPIRVLSVVGLAFVLLLAGLEVGIDRSQGRLLQAAATTSLLSFGLALILVYTLHAAGLVESPLLVAIMLTATSLGVVVPLLKDADQSGTTFGQLIIAAASIADVGTIILLSVLFSREAVRLGAKVVLLSTFGIFAAAAVIAIMRAQRSMRIGDTLVRLQDTTAQIRVRGAFLLLAAFVAMAERLGLEVIFGAFTAGAVLRLVDRDEVMTHPNFRLKLNAVGYGVFIPLFFVASGLTFNAQALLAGGPALARVPLFLVALLLVRGLPAMLYHRLIGLRRAAAAGLLQATSLPFIVVATQVGMELRMLSASTGTALVAAGLLSVVVFPLLALTMLRSPARAA